MAKEIDTSNGAVYHRKGINYQLMRFPARDETNNKKVVVYRAIVNDKWYTMEANEFFKKFTLIG